MDTELFRCAFIGGWGCVRAYHDAPGALQTFKGGGGGDGKWQTLLLLLLLLCRCFDAAGLQMMNGRHIGAVSLRVS